MCTVGDVFYNFCRPGQRDIDCRGFIQLCREGGLSVDGFGDADAEKVFLKAMAVAKRRLDLPRFVEALRYVAEKTGLEEDAVHRMLISHCNRRPISTMKRTESEPTLHKTRHDTAGEEPEVEILESSKRRHRRHLPSNRRRPKKLEVKEAGAQDPPSCQSTPGGASFGTLERVGSLDDIASARLFQMPSVNPSTCMMRPTSPASQLTPEPEPLPSPCGGTLPSPELKVLPPSPASVQSEPEPLPSPFKGQLSLDLKEPEPLPSPCRGGLSVDTKAAEDPEGWDRQESLTPNTGRSLRLPQGAGRALRPASPTASSAAVARGRHAQEETAAGPAGRHGVPTLALGDCAKANRAPDVERVDGVEETFTAFCGEHQGLDANGFVSFCKHSCLLDRNFTAQDARLVYAEAVPVSLQRMELRSFEVALAQVAAQKGMDRGHIRRMVLFQDSLCSGHSKLQVGPSLAPLPAAPAPAADLQDPLRRPAVVNRARGDTAGLPSRPVGHGVARLRGLRRSETMPPCIGKDRPPMAEAALAALAACPAAQLSGEHSDAGGSPSSAAAEQSLLLDAEPPAPTAPPAGEGVNGEEADVGGEAVGRIPSDTPSLELTGQAEVEEPAAGPWPPSRPALPLPTVPTDQACHLMPLVCAR